MGALAYLTEHGLNAELVMGSRISIWPADTITSEVEQWIIQHKTDLLAELRQTQEGHLTPWRVMYDGKEIATLLSPCTSAEEVLRGLQERWPGKRLSVKRWSKEPP